MPEFEKVACTLVYDATDNPKCRVWVNNKLVHKFTGVNGQEDFVFDVSHGMFTFKIEHYDKDMKKEPNKSIELKTIRLNGVDLKDMIWETTQIAEVPAWQNKNNFNWKSNLYLGHNGYVKYQMNSPVIDFLSDYHSKGAKVSSNMGSYDMDLLIEMKEYFTKIVEEQEKSKTK